MYFNELTVKIKTAGCEIFFILYNKQDNVNYRIYKKLNV